MLKTRLIPVLYIKNGLIVRSEGFTQHQILGNIINEASRYNSWNIDELIYIDLSRDKNYDSNRDDHKVKAVFSIEEIIGEISKVCFMPLTFGGGIQNLADVDYRIRHGADKVTINTQAFKTPELVKQVSQKYGSQCVTISIDYKLEDNSPVVYVANGSENTGVSVLDWVLECEKLGAGEIFLNSIDRDGKASGYDINTINSVVECTNLPVIACGGAADEYDFLELAKETRVSGIAAGNMFHFKEQSYPNAKKKLLSEGINVR